LVLHLTKHDTNLRNASRGVNRHSCAFSGGFCVGFVDTLSQFSRYIGGRVAE